VEILLGFGIGYIVGAKAGDREFADVLNAIQAIRRSEEFGALLQALRSHGAAALQSAAELLREKPSPTSPDTLMERVLGLMAKRDGAL
jgi:hypothetical protein